MTSLAENVDGPSMDKELARKAPQEKGESYVTLYPYTPVNTKRKERREKALNFNDLFGPQRWTKYYEMKTNVKDHFKLYSDLAIEVGCDVLFRHQKDGLCIIEAADEEQSEKLQHLADTDNKDLPIKKNQTLNVSHGTIIVPHNIETGDTEFSEASEKIKENLRIQGHEVKDVITYLKPARGSRRYPLRVAKIIFESRILPDTVIVAGQRLSVREFVPAPRQCAKCWKYGHSIKYCKAEAYTCPICGVKGHQKESCTHNNKMCINCQEKHPAFSKSCTHYKKEQLIVKTSFKEGMSYKEAINKLKQTGQISSLNYKKALESKKPTITSTPRVSKPHVTNRFSVLEIEEQPQNSVSQNHSSQVSPKRIFKRIRDSSSEEGELSPKLNPKQKAKTKNQGSKVHEIVADVHASEVISMDDTIIYTDTEHERLDVETGETSFVPSESTLPIGLPTKSTSSVLPSEPSEQNILTSEPSIPATVPSESSVSTAEPLENPIPAMSSEASMPTDMSSEASLPTAVPSQTNMPNVMPSGASMPTALSKSPQSTVASLKSPLQTGAPSNPSLPKKSGIVKAASVYTSRNMKQDISKVPSKNPTKKGVPKPSSSKVKNLVRDYHMPPGFRDGK